MGGRAAATIPSVSTVGHDSSWLARGRLWFNRLNQNRPGVLSGAAQVNGRDIAAGASVLDWADIAPDPAYLDSAHIARGRTLAMVSAEIACV